MDVSTLSSISSQNYPTQQAPTAGINIYDSEVNIDYLIINSLPPPGLSKSDRISVGYEGMDKSLSLTAKKIIEKLNELLKDAVPQGIESLKPEEFTPEATADRIVKATTAFFDIYADQHPELQGEELLEKFLTTIKGGIDKGYGEAYDLLDSMGAFEFDGVREAVEQTKILIDTKLQSYEAFKRKELGLEPSVDQETSTIAKNTFLEQGGVRLG